ncbi:Aldo/keto reductase family protein [Streptoalloteichus tenebrarius]|uniref:Aldo/keto reductase family protein n=1 Tax=Streptoalloteichus tenebrarius (strain ATCC 17920 / DSM 40477 / JCM 4838 / CBS 697.72 / NBRC 16177 / NCIMB 11028 / NRRL B-12390 / A12253. 1 / ISP 5477) TaxID=1933 RepID=A0ABT1HM72_STRSD|nr:aldo/keto reductase [Streptoalloteichus tenebrarius]MCP2256616.1 Aldo/keto reductase family protein [Streptoalloteichus tenebrarius]BFF04969.1 hypothetical protein GCM10020241_66440 [Streptoalloteichus tenebrarius]
MSVTGTYGPPDPREAAATLLEALDLRVTVLDTAGFYVAGTNEELLGRTLARQRHRGVLAINTRVRRTADDLVPPGSPDDLRRACAASLRHPRTDHLDR